MQGYFAGSVLMVLAALTEVFLGVKAEKKSLEEIASPLSAEERSGGDRRGPRRRNRNVNF